MNTAVNPNRKHDIRATIPLTKFTNPGDFPQHVHRDFPLMLTCYGEERMVKGKPHKPVIPVVDENNQPIIVADDGELETYLDNVEPEKAEEIRSLLPRSAEERQEETQMALSKLADSEAENAKLRRLLAKFESGDTGGDDEDSEADAPKTNHLTGKTSKPAKSALPPKLKATK